MTQAVPLSDAKARLAHLLQASEASADEEVASWRDRTPGRPMELW